MGTGGVKVGGNYAASLLPHELAVEQSSTTRKFADAIYLDPKTHTKIEEVGRRTSLGLPKTTNSSPRFQSRFCQVLPNTHCYTLLKSV